MSRIKYINYYNVFFPTVFPQSIRRRVLKKKNMVGGRVKLCVASSSEEDMYSSCFSTTKYTCLKCKIPICNNCSVFEKDKDSSGWAPLNESVGSLRALCTGVCKRHTEDCITLMTAFLFFFLLSVPVFFTENKLLLIFILFSASAMFSTYVSPLTKIGNFP